MNLFINYYRDKHPHRDQELQNGLRRNLENPYIKRVFLMMDFVMPFPDHDKIEPVYMASRPTYAEIFDCVRENSVAGEVCIIANSDIYFDSSIGHCLTMDANACYALSRWDMKGNTPVPFLRSDSQDAWIFRAPVKDVKNCNFTMGVPGCDNRIAYELLSAGYHVTNPSKTIKAYHLHETGIRHYKVGQNVVARPYHLVPPISL